MYVQGYVELELYANEKTWGGGNFSHKTNVQIPNLRPNHLTFKLCQICIDLAGSK